MGKRMMNAALKTQFMFIAFMVNYLGCMNSAMVYELTKDSVSLSSSAWQFFFRISRAH